MTSLHFGIRSNEIAGCAFVTDSHLIQLHQFVVVTRLLILSCCPSRVLQSIHQTSELEAHTTLKALMSTTPTPFAVRNVTLSVRVDGLYLLPVGIFSDQMKEHRDIDFAKKTGFLQCGRSSNSNSPPVARQRSSSLLYNYTPSSSTFLDPPESISQPTSRSAQPFLHSSRQIVPIFCNGPTFPLKIVPLHGIWTPI